MDQNIATYLQNQQQRQQPPTLPPLQQPMQAAMGGMGAAANLGQMAQGQFSDTHNQMYENLRKVLMQLHQTGMPGIDKVLNTLNQQHVSQMKPPTMPGQQQQEKMPTMPQAALGTTLPGSLEALAEQQAGYPPGFMRWYDNTTGMSHTQIPSEQLPNWINKYLASGSPALPEAQQQGTLFNNVMQKFAGSAVPTAEIGSVTLDTILPLIANLSIYKNLLQQQPQAQKQVNL